MLGLALRTRAGAPMDGLAPTAVGRARRRRAASSPIAGRVVLTRAGRLLANEVTVRLIA